ncbi:MAG: undecaprenyl/decaprenyl-phosphate alpha-N-acetylglucosaminyl 1-phosphate transferase [Candidatus Magasanikbacteria bacterium]|nr:undecaprenyl/decaprenyl-phosphate alpha-N-acetylglucosaminyl 1-phosphate transferase [Candidatus Magasanikbacteria bacterium]
MISSFYFLFSLILSFVFAFFLIRVMKRWRILDRRRPVPLGGGMAIYGSFLLSAWLLLLNGRVSAPADILAYMFGLSIGGLVLMIGGFIDDRYNLRARWQIIFAVLAAGFMAIGAPGPVSLTHPLGGSLSLMRFTIFLPVIGTVAVFSSLVTFCWLMGLMYTTKFLDGLDGLVAGIVAIGGAVIFLITREPRWADPDVNLLAIVFIAACLGFLAWNWSPAKIFLGEGGSLFTGYALGVLAIAAGGKIATTLLVMAVPVIDVLRVIVLRLRKGQPFFVGDREHLHFKLQKLGLSSRQTVLLFYGISALFGMVAFFWQREERFIAVAAGVVLSCLLGVWFSRRRTVLSR